MTYVAAQPQLMATAAADVAGIPSAINQTTAAAASATTGIETAAADEASAATATLFNACAQEFQAILKQAAYLHGEFVQALTAAGSAYAGAETANAALVSAVSGEVTAPAQASGISALSAMATPASSPLNVTLVMGAAAPRYLGRDS